jgi:hypothetical protein
MLCITKTIVMRRLELYNIVRTNNDAIVWCRQRRLIISSSICSECGCEMKEGQDAGVDGRIWKCRKTISGVRHQESISIRHRCFISGHKIDFKNAIYLLYEWSIKTSVSQAAYELQLSEKYVIKFYKTMRKVCTWGIDSRVHYQIGGEGIIVEIDECQLGRRKSHRGRIPREIWVFGGLEGWRAGSRFQANAMLYRNCKKTR